jgi:ABC-type transport system involved in multi-copper enzyme maturation permease subunit
MGPLFWREWMTIPRAGRNHIARVVYAGTFWVLAVTAWLSGADWNRPTLISDLSRLGILLFSLFSLLQLALFLFFSALSTASAVALEKDRRTFILLLITDLKNSELVGGKILGSLLGIFLLWVAGFPISLLLTVLGGVSIEQVLWVQAILLSTMFAGG